KRTRRGAPRSADAMSSGAAVDGSCAPFFACAREVERADANTTPGAVEYDMTHAPERTRRPRAPAAGARRAHRDAGRVHQDISTSSFGGGDRAAKQGRGITSSIAGAIPLPPVSIAMMAHGNGAGDGSDIVRRWNGVAALIRHPQEHEVHRRGGRPGC